MTTEQKAKAYDEALERARVYRNNAKIAEDYIAVARYENIFPQLRESEDERMTRVIGLALTDVPEERFTSLGTTLKDCLAYLKKQKDHFRDDTKMVELQDYSGLNDLERAIHRGFLSAGVENVPVTIIKETANECKRTQTIANENANAEWNEEDKSFYDSIMCEVVKEGMHLTPAQANWFKLLPERFNLKPHRKPSKEQEEPKYYQHFDPDC